MVVPRGRTGQTGDLYRKLNEQESTNVDTYINDQRFDLITEKVIQYMYAADPADWSKELWMLFRTLWADRKSKRRQTEQLAAQDMTMTELENMMDSDDH